MSPNVNLLCVFLAHISCCGCERSRFENLIGGCSRRASCQTILPSTNCDRTCCNPRTSGCPQAPSRPMQGSVRSGLRSYSHRNLSRALRKAAILQVGPRTCGYSATHPCPPRRSGSGRYRNRKLRRQFCPASRPQSRTRQTRECRQCLGQTDSLEECCTFMPPVSILNQTRLASILSAFNAARPADRTPKSLSRNCCSRTPCKPLGLTWSKRPTPLCFRICFLASKRVVAINTVPAE